VALKRRRPAFPFKSGRDPADHTPWQAIPIARRTQVRRAASIHAVFVAFRAAGREREDAVPFVKKRRMTVRVCLPGEESSDGQFFIAEPQSGGAAETLLGLLNSRRRIVPFVMSEDSRVRMLTRQCIDWVLAGPEVPPELIGVDPAFVADENVELAFMDARTISGKLVRPHQGELRLSDHLNGPEDFFALRTRVGTLLVNKLRVAGMLLVDSRAEIRTPAPEDLRGAA
jgi:hypothetical protein